MLILLTKRAGVAVNCTVIMAPCSKELHEFMSQAWMPFLPPVPSSVILFLFVSGTTTASCPESIELLKGSRIDRMRRR